jgi:hypothetical protein
MSKSSFFLLLCLPLCAQVKFTPRPDQIPVEIDGKPFTVFIVGGQDIHRPYLFPLRSASGKIVTRSNPPGQLPGESTDHPHHVGLFYGHGDVNGYNYWAIMSGPEAARQQAAAREAAAKKGAGKKSAATLSSAPTNGSIVLSKPVSVKDGKASGTIVAVFNHLTPDGKPMMTETRKMVFYSDPKLRTIDFDFDLAAIDKVVFHDTKEGTFAMRMATALEEPHTEVIDHPNAVQGVTRTGKMTNAQGAQGEANVWGKRSEWVDYCGVIEGEEVGVVMMDHPSNPRFPTYWHSRAYGLHSINPFGVHDFLNDSTKDGSMTIEPGQHVRFRYRVIIHPGNTQSADIAGLYKKWAATK